MLLTPNKLWTPEERQVRPHQSRLSHRSGQLVVVFPVAVVLAVVTVVEIVVAVVVDLAVVVTVVVLVLAFAVFSSWSCCRGRRGRLRRPQSWVSLCAQLSAKYSSYVPLSVPCALLLGFQLRCVP